ncbi:hypothetical protein GGF31_005434 [Allomyces arbusculus]|nr:hypothetical protein GGF31_005434 [Allomyces arbusculus]
MHRGTAPHDATSSVFPADWLAKDRAVLRDSMAPTASPSPPLPPVSRARSEDRQPLQDDRRSAWSSATTSAAAMDAASSARIGAGSSARRTRSATRARSRARTAATVAAAAAGMPDATDLERERHQFRLMRIREKTYDVNLVSTSMPIYEPLLDEYLQDHLNTPSIRHHLVSLGVIDEDGYIVDDRTFKYAQLALDRAERETDLERSAQQREIDREVEVALRHAQENSATARRLRGRGGDIWTKVTEHYAPRMAAAAAARAASASPSGSPSASPPPTSHARAMTASPTSRATTAAAVSAAAATSPLPPVPAHRIHASGISSRYNLQSSRTSSTAGTRADLAPTSAVWGGTASSTRPGSADVVRSRPAGARAARTTNAAAGAHADTPRPKSANVRGRTTTPTPGGEDARRDPVAEFYNDYLKDEFDAPPHDVSTASLTSVGRGRDRGVAEHAERATVSAPRTPPRATSSSPRKSAARLPTSPLSNHTSLPGSSSWEAAASESGSEPMPAPSRPRPPTAGQTRTARTAAVSVPPPTTAPDPILADAPTQTSHHDLVATASQTSKHAALAETAVQYSDPRLFRDDAQQTQPVVLDSQTQTTDKVARDAMVQIHANALESAQQTSETCVTARNVQTDTTSMEEVGVQLVGPGMRGAGTSTAALVETAGVGTQSAPSRGVDSEVQADAVPRIEAGVQASRRTTSARSIGAMTSNPTLAGPPATTPEDAKAFEASLLAIHAAFQQRDYPLVQRLGEDLVATVTSVPQFDADPLRKAIVAEAYFAMSRAAYHAHDAESCETHLLLAFRYGVDAPELLKDLIRFKHRLIIEDERADAAAAGGSEDVAMDPAEFTRTENLLFEYIGNLGGDLGKIVRQVRISKRRASTNASKADPTSSEAAVAPPQPGTTPTKDSRRRPAATSPTGSKAAVGSKSSSAASVRRTPSAGGAATPTRPVTAAVASPYAESQLSKSLENVRASRSASKSDVRRASRTESIVAAETTAGTGAQGMLRTSSVTTSRHGLGSGAGSRASLARASATEPAAAPVQDVAPMSRSASLAADEARRDATKSATGSRPASAGKSRRDAATAGASRPSSKPATRTASMQDKAAHTGSTRSLASFRGSAASFESAFDPLVPMAAPAGGADRPMSVSKSSGSVQAVQQEQEPQRAGSARDVSAAKEPTNNETVGQVPAQDVPGPAANEVADALSAPADEPALDPALVAIPASVAASVLLVKSALDVSSPKSAASRTDLTAATTTALPASVAASQMLVESRDDVLVEEAPETVQGDAPAPVPVAVQQEPVAATSTDAPAVPIADSHGTLATHTPLSASVAASQNLAHGHDETTPHVRAAQSDSHLATTSASVELPASAAPSHILARQPAESTADAISEPMRAAPAAAATKTTASHEHLTSAAGVALPASVAASQALLGSRGDVALGTRSHPTGVTVAPVPLVPGIGLLAGAAGIAMLTSVAAAQASSSCSNETGSAVVHEEALAASSDHLASAAGVACPVSVAASQVLGRGDEPVSPSIQEEPLVAPVDAPTQPITSNDHLASATCIALPASVAASQVLARHDDSAAPIHDSQPAISNDHLTSVAGVALPVSVAVSQVLASIDDSTTSPSYEQPPITAVAPSQSAERVASAIGAALPASVAASQTLARRDDHVASTSADQSHKASADAPLKPAVSDDHLTNAAGIALPASIAASQTLARGDDVALEQPLATTSEVPGRPSAGDDHLTSAAGVALPASGVVSQMLAHSNDDISHGALAVPLPVSVAASQSLRVEVEPALLSSSSSQMLARSRDSLEMAARQAFPASVAASQALALSPTLSNATSHDHLANATVGIVLPVSAAAPQLLTRNRDEPHDVLPTVPAHQPASHDQLAANAAGIALPASVAASTILPPPEVDSVESRRMDLTATDLQERAASDDQIVDVAAGMALPASVAASQMLTCRSDLLRDASELPLPLPVAVSQPLGHSCTNVANPATENASAPPLETQQLAAQVATADATPTDSRPLSAPVSQVLTESRESVSGLAAGIALPVSVAASQSLAPAVHLDVDPVSVPLPSSRFASQTLSASHGRLTEVAAGALLPLSLAASQMLADGPRGAEVESVPAASNELAPLPAASSVDDVMDRPAGIALPASVVASQRRVVDGDTSDSASVADRGSLNNLTAAAIATQLPASVAASQQLVVDDHIASALGAPLPHSVPASELLQGSEIWSTSPSRTDLAVALNALLPVSVTASQALIPVVDSADASVHDVPQVTGPEHGLAASSPREDNEPHSIDPRIVAMPASVAVSMILANGPDDSALSPHSVPIPVSVASTVQLAGSAATDPLVMGEADADQVPIPASVAASTAVLASSRSSIAEVPVDPSQCALPASVAASTVLLSDRVGSVEDQTNRSAEARFVPLPASVAASQMLFGGVDAELTRSADPLGTSLPASVTMSLPDSGLAATSTAGLAHSVPLPASVAASMALLNDTASVHEEERGDNASSPRFVPLPASVAASMILDSVSDAASIPQSDGTLEPGSPSESWNNNAVIERIPLKGGSDPASPRLVPLPASVAASMNTLADSKSRDVLVSAAAVALPESVSASRELLNSSRFAKDDATGPTIKPVDDDHGTLAHDVPLPASVAASLNALSKTEPESMANLPASDRPTSARDDAALAGSSARASKSGSIDFGQVPLPASVAASREALSTPPAAVLAPLAAALLVKNEPTPDSDATAVSLPHSIASSLNVLNESASGNTASASNVEAIHDDNNAVRVPLPMSIGASMSLAVHASVNEAAVQPHAHALPASVAASLQLLRDTGSIESVASHAAQPASIALPASVAASQMLASAPDELPAPVASAPRRDVTQSTILFEERACALEMKPRGEYLGDMHTNVPLPNSVVSSLLNLTESRQSAATVAPKTEDLAAVTPHRELTHSTILLNERARALELEEESEYRGDMHPNVPLPESMAPSLANLTGPVEVASSSRHELTQSTILFAERARDLDSDQDGGEYRGDMHANVPLPESIMPSLTSLAGTGLDPSTSTDRAESVGPTESVSVSSHRELTQSTILFEERAQALDLHQSTEYHGDMHANSYVGDMHVNVPMPASVMASCDVLAASGRAASSSTARLPNDSSSSNAQLALDPRGVQLPASVAALQQLVAPRGNERVERDQQVDQDEPCLVPLPASVAASQTLAFDDAVAAAPELNRAAVEVKGPLPLLPPGNAEVHYSELVSTNLAHVAPPTEDPVSQVNPERVTLPPSVYSSHAGPLAEEPPESAGCSSLSSSAATEKIEADVEPTLDPAGFALPASVAASQRLAPSTRASGSRLMLEDSRTMPEAVPLPASVAASQTLTTVPGSFIDSLLAGAGPRPSFGSSSLVPDAPLDTSQLMSMSFPATSELLDMLPTGDEHLEETRESQQMADWSLSTNNMDLPLPNSPPRSADVLRPRSVARHDSDTTAREADAVPLPLSTASSVAMSRASSARNSLAGSRSSVLARGTALPLSAEPSVALAKSLSHELHADERQASAPADLHADPNSSAVSLPPSLAASQKLDDTSFAPRTSRPSSSAAEDRTRTNDASHDTLAQRPQSPSTLPASKSPSRRSIRLAAETALPASTSSLADRNHAEPAALQSILGGLDEALAAPLPASVANLAAAETTRRQGSASSIRSAHKSRAGPTSVPLPASTYASTEVLSGQKGRQSPSTVSRTPLSGARSAQNLNKSKLAQSASVLSLRAVESGESIAAAAGVTLPASRGTVALRPGSAAPLPATAKAPSRPASASIAASRSPRARIIGPAAADVPLPPSVAGSRDTVTAAPRRAPSQGLEFTATNAVYMPLPASVAGSRSRLADEHESTPRHLAAKGKEENDAMPAQVPLPASVARSAQELRERGA